MRQVTKYLVIILSVKIHLLDFVGFTAYVGFRLISKIPALQYRILIGFRDIQLKNHL